MKEIIFIGLQNNFKQYFLTRHNAGAILLSEIEKECREKKIESISFLYSPGYMNESGNVFTKEWKNKIYLQRFKINLWWTSKVKTVKKNDGYKNIFVFCDDVNIPIGEFKISFAEGATSHNGIKSIAEKLGSKNFYRVRVGVGKKIKDENGKNINWRPDANEMTNYVLGNMKKEEIENIKSLKEIVIKELQKYF